MAASNTAIGFGADLLKETATPGTYASLGVEIDNIGLPSYAREAIDVTHMASPDSHREFIEGLLDAGEVSISGNFAPSATDKVVAELTGGKANYRILFAGGVSWTFAAICTSYQPTAPVDGKMTFSATFKVSGKPVLA